MKIKLKCSWRKLNPLTEEKVFAFEHYYIRKKGARHYVVLEIGSDTEITSGTSIGNACKKVKLLEIGYKNGYDDAKDVYAPLLYGDYDPWDL